jgi:hypothetical protein
VRQAPPTQLERRGDLRRARAADARDPHEIVGGAARQAMQATMGGQQGIGDAQRVTAP